MTTLLAFLRWFADRSQKGAIRIYLMGVILALYALFIGPLWLTVPGILLLALGMYIVVRTS